MSLGIEMNCNVDQRKVSTPDLAEDSSFDLNTDQLTSQLIKKGLHTAKQKVC